MTSDEFFYRIEDQLMANSPDESGESYGSHVAIRVRKLRVLRHTPKGTWVEGPRFILRAAIKHYACPSMEEAELSFLARKQKQVAIYRGRIQQINRAVEILKMRTREKAGT